MNRTLSFYPLTLLCAAIAIAGQAQAVEVLIDFGGANNPTVVGNYNNAAAARAPFQSIADFPTLTGMIDATGASTGFGLDLVAVADVPSVPRLGIGGFNTAPSPNNSGFLDSAAADTMFILANGPGNTAAFELSDLKTDGTTYSLGMYGFIGGQDRTLTEWTVGGVSAQLDPQNNTSTRVDFSNVAPVGGVIDIGFTSTVLGGGFAQAHWNAFEIVDDTTGQTLLVDFGRDDNLTGSNYNNVAAAGGSEFSTVDSWPTLLDMIDDSGVATSYDLDLVSVTNPTFGIGGPVGTGIAGFNAAPIPNDSGFEDAAAADSLFVFDTTDATFEVTGLKTDGTSYNLEFYGYITADRTLMEIEIDGVIQTLDTQDNTDGILQFASLTPDATGTISFTVGAGVNGGGVRQAQLSAMRIVEVPEPSAAIIAAMILGVALTSRHSRSGQLSS